MGKRHKNKRKHNHGSGTPWYRLTDEQKSAALCKRALPTERDLVRHLCERGVRGWGFRWNTRVAGYFPDFTCEPLALIIEIDGKSHEGREVANAKRQADLEAQGYEVRRLPSRMPLDQKLSAIDGFVCNRLAALGMTPSPTVLEARAAQEVHRNLLAD